MGVPDGPQYMFYQTGSIKKYRNWINGKMSGLGEDYWEKDGNIKAVYFAKDDTLTYARYFDQQGIVIKTVGKDPDIQNAKIR